MRIAAGPPATDCTGPARPRAADPSDKRSPSQGGRHCGDCHSSDRNASHVPGEKRTSNPSRLCLEVPAWVMHRQVPAPAVTSSTRGSPSIGRRAR